MELTAEQIAFIRQELHDKGITMNSLVESLVDHICCTIENEPDADFHQSYHKALLKFEEGELKKIQQKTILLLISKKEEIMKKTMFVLGYIAAFLSSTGLLFKVQHWPGAAIMLTLGIVLLNFGFLPMFFYDRYKSTHQVN